MIRPKTLYLTLVMLMSLYTTHTFAAQATPDQERIYSQEIDDSLKKPSFIEKVQALHEIVLDRTEFEASGIARYTNKNQLQFFDALKAVFGQQAGQDMNALTALKALLESANNSASSLLRDAQKLYIKNQFITKLTAIPSTPSTIATTIAQQATPVAALPTQATQPQTPSQQPVIVPTVGVPTQPTQIAQAGQIAATPTILPTQQPTTPVTVIAAPVIQQPSVNNAMPISLALIQGALKQPDQVKKVKNLKALLTLAEGFTFGPDLQNAFAQELVALTQDPALSATTMQPLRKALIQAVASPLLAPAQQAYIKNTVLPNVNVGKKRSQTKKYRNKRRTKRVHKKQTQRQQQEEQKIVAAVTKALQKTTPKEQIQELLKVTRKAAKKTFSSQTQDMFGNGLVTIFNNHASYKPADLMALKKLMIRSQKTPLLSPVQQKYITEQMLKQLP